MSDVSRRILSFLITDIDLNAQLTFVFLCGCNVMSHIHESAVLMENNLTQRKGLDVIFSLLVMTKIDSYLKNKLGMLLSPMNKIGSYSKNKLFMPLSPICRNYPQTGPISTAAD